MLFRSRKFGRYVDFKNIPQYELKEQINKLKEVTDRNIHDTILKNVKDKKRAEHLFQILVSRKEYILKH